MSETVDVIERVRRAFDEMPNPKLDAKNPHFKNRYASLDGVLDTVKPVLTKYGLRLQQSATGDNTSFVTSVNDAYSNTVLVSVRTPFITGAENPQAVGSAITYARRYGVLLLFNLVGEEDDDAEKAMGRTTSSAGNVPAATGRKVVRR